MAKDTFDESERFEFETFIAAIRYYEYRNTIASSMYPAELIKRLWRHGGPAKRKLIDRIAHQFAFTDHKTEDDWENQPNCDRKPWVKFYQFCKGWAFGFPKIIVEHPDGTQHWMDAFKTEFDGAWYFVSTYLETPEFTPSVIPEAIKKIQLPPPPPKY